MVRGPKGPGNATNGGDNISGRPMTHELKQRAATAAAVVDKVINEVGSTPLKTINAAFKAAAQVATEAAPKNNQNGIPRRPAVPQNTSPQDKLGKISSEQPKATKLAKVEAKKDVANSQNRLAQISSEQPKAIKLAKVEAKKDVADSRTRLAQISSEPQNEVRLAQVDRRTSYSNPEARSAQVLPALENGFSLAQVDRRTSYSNPEARSAQVLPALENGFSLAQVDRRTSYSNPEARSAQVLPALENGFSLAQVDRRTSYSNPEARSAQVLPALENGFSLAQVDRRTSYSNPEARSAQVLPGSQTILTANQDDQSDNTASSPNNRTVGQQPTATDTQVAANDTATQDQSTKPVQRNNEVKATKVDGQARTEVVAVEGKPTNGTAGTYTISEQPQVGGKQIEVTQFNRDIDRRIDELPRTEPRDHVPVVEVGRPGAVIVADAGAAPGTTGRPADVTGSTPSVVRDRIPAEIMSRESVAVTPGQMVAANQMSNALYMNDAVAKGVNGQSTLTVRESNSVGYLANQMLSRESQGAGLASVGTIGQGILQSGDVRGTGIAGALPIGEGAKGAQTGIQSILQSLDGTAGARGIGQNITMLQQGQGAIKGIDDGSKITGLIPGSASLAPTVLTETSGKKGSTAPGEITTTVSSIINTTVVKEGKLIDGVEETKLAAGTIPGTQSPLAGITGGLTPAPTTNTTNKDPNTQNTTTTQTTTTKGGKDEDWADTLPEVEIVDTRKEVVVDIDDDDDYDHQEDQFVANDGRRGGGAYTPGSRATDNIRGLIEIIVADNAGKKLDDTKAAQLFEHMFGDNTRRQYTVKPGDTIEEIALRLLKDKRLIPLLLNVNELNTITEYTDRLQSGLVMELPSRSQILRYKVHVLNDASPLMVYANTLGESSNIAGVANEFIAYTCRLGDTLQSIARRHPAIADENRWQEIAELNGLSGEAYLERGQKINLPRPQAVVDELEEYDEDDSVSRIDSILSAGGYNPVAQDHDGQTVVSNNIIPLMNKLKSSILPVETKEVAATTRVVTQNDLGDNTEALRLRLEMKVDNHWLPVVEYDIQSPESGQTSGLKIYDLYGVRQVIPLALPTRAARELAENDITTNSQRYCKVFLADHQIAA